MQKSEKVSIIIPVYNVEKYLKKCIESVLNQTYTNIEIILVDDGSKDKSGIICDEYEKKDVRVKVIHKKNGGVSSARNSGIEAAKGDFMCFVDGDDYVMEEYVEYMLNLLKQNDAEISLTTEMFGNFDSEQTKNQNVEICNAEETTEKILCYKIPIGVYCKLFKSNFIKENDIKFFENIFMGEGFNFNVYCFQRATKVAIGNKKIYYYRRDNSTSATTKFSIEKCENSIYALDIMKEKFIINSNRIFNAWNYAKWRTYSDAFDYMVLGNGIEDNKDKYIEYKKYVKKYAKTSLNVPISYKNKIRALIMWIYPGAIPTILKFRRKIYNVNIKGEKNV